MCDIVSTYISGLPSYPTDRRMVGPRTLTLEIEGREIFTTQIDGFPEARIFANRIKSILNLGPDTDYQIYVTCRQLEKPCTQQSDQVI